MCCQQSLRLKWGCTKESVLSPFLLMVMLNSMTDLENVVCC